MDIWLVIGVYHTTVYTTVFVTVADENHYSITFTIYRAKFVFWTSMMQLFAYIMWALWLSAMQGK